MPSFLKQQRFTFQSLVILHLLSGCGEPVRLVLGDWLWAESTSGLRLPGTP